MLEQDVKYLKFKTYLNTYCPFCHQSFNVEKKDYKQIEFKAKYKGQEIDIFLSPYLDVFDSDTSVPVQDGDCLEDLMCPHCQKSLINPETNCGECGTPVASVIISALSKLVPFFICLCK